jgi:hypothetical protein
VDEREFILGELFEETHDELELVFIHRDAGVCMVSAGLLGLFAFAPGTPAMERAPAAG